MHIILAYTRMYQLDSLQNLVEQFCYPFSQMNSTVVCSSLSSKNSLRIEITNLLFKFTAGNLRRREDNNSGLRRGRLQWRPTSKQPRGCRQG